MFKRKIYDKLLQWKKDSDGKTALLIEGARRIGKSTIVESFGRNEYKSYIIIDFSIVSKNIRELFEDISDLNYLFLQLQLQYAKIPFVMTSGVKFFEQAHVKDIVSQIKFVANPKDNVSFLRFCRFMPKIGDKTAFKIFEKIREVAASKSLPEWRVLSDKKVLAKVPAAAKQMFEAAAADIEKLGGLVELAKRSEKHAEADSAEKIPVQTDFFADMAHASEREAPADPAAENTTEADFSPKAIIKCACGGWYRDAMKTLYEDWEERAADFDALFEYASKFDDFDDFLASVALEISDAEGRESEVGGRVRLMTVHQAKGLEFPVVFVIGAAEGLFPTQRSIDDGDVEEEIGDLIFAVTNVSRFVKVDSERAAEKTCNKFVRHFADMEQQAKAQGRQLSELTLEEMDALWDEAKKKEHRE